MAVSRDELTKLITNALSISPKRNFKQSVELILVLKDIDPKSQEAKVRETVFLPKDVGKEVRICVIAEGEMAIKAREAGTYKVLTKADLSSVDKKTAKKMASECDWILVRSDLMGLAGKILGPALGPRGKVPVPIPVNIELAALIERYRRAIYVRNKDQLQISCRIGTEDMNPSDIAENALAVISAVEAKLPNHDKNIGEVIVKTTMGPPVKIKIG
ncbi:MAG: 50S ribosomal protein L1 [Desulfurococcaceae archaeon]|nr:50S ribosomal protein L1 [Desulfurococcaceae archaeon]